ncbi:MAG: (2Fe-2S)-binding protein [Tenericutes bacterium HGW-Tenericutes-3]|nr:MAG: (2Fe-2S)-binding protein [Tenericutes bacterium HGW-Tenericutes-3]
MSKKDIIICRCEDVNLQELHDLMNQGFTSIEDLKRQLRVGMGPCQGATCLPIIQRELAIFLKKPIEEIPLPTVRPLTLGVPLKAIARGAKDEK